MREATIHCSARDADVRALFTDEPLYDGQASLCDAELICLDVGESCTDCVCPLGARAPTEMDVALVRMGLEPEHHAPVRALCAGCDRVTELRHVIGGFVTCTECGTTIRSETLL